MHFLISSLLRIRILLDHLRVEVHALAYALVHAVIRVMDVLVNVPTLVPDAELVLLHVAQIVAADAPGIVLMNVLVDARPHVRDVKVNAQDNAKVVTLDVVAHAKMAAIRNAVTLVQHIVIPLVKVHAIWDAQRNVLVHARIHPIQKHVQAIAALLTAL